MKKHFNTLNPMAIQRNQLHENLANHSLQSHLDCFHGAVWLKIDIVVYL